MRLNYDRLGPYIREIDVRNRDLSVKKLLGVNVGKVMMDSKANLVGTDLSKYKVVKTSQFVYGPVTSRNGDRIAISICEADKCIVSVSYTAFEIINEQKLLPEYLMMWFRRPEFDRYARFHSHGSVRELFGWDEMCDVELPIPSIEKQREIVKEYQTVVDRIRLNERLNEKLEEAAQAIYKQWFVKFEFPMTAEYAESIGKPELAGRPYKSSGGEMEYNEVLEQEIPKGWKDAAIGEFVSSNENTLADRDLKKFKSLLYLDTGSVTANRFSELQSLEVGVDEIPSRARRKVKNGSIVYSTVRPALRHYGVIRNPPSNMVVSTGFAVLDCKDNRFAPELILQILTQEGVLKEFSDQADMSVTTYPSIRPDDLYKHRFPLPDNDVLKLAKRNVPTLNNTASIFLREVNVNSGLADLILTKMSLNGAK